MLRIIVALALGMIGQDWYTLAPEGKNFRVRLPSAPSGTSSRPVITAAGRSQLTSARLQTPDASYSVQVTENRAKVDPNTLDEGIRRFAATKQATLGAVAVVSVGDNPGRDFEMTERTSEGLRRSRMRWVTSGHSLFMLAVAGRPGAGLPADADRFLGSLEIGGVKSPTVGGSEVAVETEVAEPAPKGTVEKPKVAARAAGKPDAEETESNEPQPDVVVGEPEAASKASGKPAARKPAAAGRITLSPIPRGARRHPEERLADLARSFLGSDRDGFRDVGPAGSVLVGVRVSYIDHGGPKVRSAQPIYRAGAKHYLGQVHGEVVGPVTTVVARPGYAVGGLVTHTGLTVDGFRMVFMRVDGDRLDPEDSYNSRWLGDERGGGPGEVMSKGELVVGLQGRSRNEVFALGLTALK